VCAVAIEVDLRHAGDVSGAEDDEAGHADQSLTSMVNSNKGVACRSDTRGAMRRLQ
jgi:hypothetical protein